MFAGLSSGGEIKAFAKINLHLRVLNKRDDGYHEIVSLMAAVGLHDLLKLEHIDEDAKHGPSVEIYSRGGSFEQVIESTPLKENLIYRAAFRYCEEAGVTPGIVFGIKKNIPAGAGMGGGSADAAGALRLLNLVYRRFDEAGLAKIGRSIGADVPFCLAGGMALCEGVGELVTPLPGRLKYSVVIANNGTHVDTAGAYRSLNRGKSLPWSGKILADEKKRIIDAVQRGTLEEITALLVNDFEGPVFRDHPDIAWLKKSMGDTGAFHSAMTGSGSTIIGLFKNAELAGEAVKKLRKTTGTVLVTDFEERREITGL